MPAPKTTIWSMEDHTRVKHVILKKYLDAWIPIVTSYDQPAIYIDGFAGPGEYEGNEPGSPIIAIEAWLHRNNVDKAQNFSFIFIEEKVDRVQHLKGILQTRYPHVQHQVVSSTFFATMNDMLDERENQLHDDIATFVFIDPFGISHTPMSVIHRLMQHKKSEVLITFMYEFVNRIYTADYSNKEAHYDELFGTSDWHHIITPHMPPDERKQQIYNLYVRQLQQFGGAKYIRSFRMDTKRNQTEYFLFFGTNSLGGLKAMKQAMIGADPTKSYSFSDVTGIDQIALFTEHQPPVRNWIERKYKVNDDVSVEDMEEFVLVDTPYISFKKDALRPMEHEGVIKVISNPDGVARKKGTFKDGTIIRFITRPPALL